MTMKILTLNKPNIIDFAKERNNLLNKSKSDWNLFLDSDEKLSKPAFNISDKYDYYFFYRKNYFLKNYVGTDRLVRLVKKGTGEWKRIVHEKWVPKKISRVGGMYKSYIIHDTADKLADYISKINNYSTLHAKANFLEGKRSSLCKIVLFPIGKFILTFVISRNVVFSIMQSLHSFLSWTKLYLHFF